MYYGNGEKSEYNKNRSVLNLSQSYSQTESTYFLSISSVFFLRKWSEIFNMAPLRLAEQNLVWYYKETVNHWKDFVKTIELLWKSWSFPLSDFPPSQPHPILYFFFFLFHCYYSTISLTTETLSIIRKVNTLKSILQIKFGRNRCTFVSFEKCFKKFHSNHIQLLHANKTSVVYS